MLFRFAGEQFSYQRHDCLMFCSDDGDGLQRLDSSFRQRPRGGSSSCQGDVKLTNRGIELNGLFKIQNCVVVTFFVSHHHAVEIINVGNPRRNASVIWIDVQCLEWEAEGRFRWSLVKSIELSC